VSSAGDPAGLRSDATAAQAPEERLRSLALGWLFISGGAIGAVSMLLPHAAGANDLALWSNIALALLAGAGLLAAGGRLPLWGFHLTMALGVLVIARAVFYSGEEVSFYSVWFIWVGLYSFYFFGRRAAALHVSFAAGVYALTLVAEPGTSPVARWLTTVATLVVAGVLIDTLVKRARVQAEAAEESAVSMAAVAKVSQELSRLTESAAARSALCEAAAGVSGAYSVALWEPASNGTGLTITGSAGSEPDQRSVPFVTPNAGAALAFATAEAVTADRPEAVRRMTPEQLGVRRTPQACLWQPVLRDDQTVAVMALYFGEAMSVDRRSLRTVVHLLAAEAAVTLQRAELLERLEAMARTDDLTGLPNRRAWEEELPRELARARRDSQELSVAMLDLDHFKLFNDRYGHQAGDRLLKQAASAWGSQLRSTDVLARYGGEEFALALSGGSPSADVRVVEHLRRVTPEGVTCSAGLVRWDGAESAEELLGRADVALYEAKRAGRDQVVAA